MRRVQVSTNGSLCGEVTLPPSKSMAHRLLVCAALYGSRSVEIECSETGEDLTATMECLKSLGAEIGTDYNRGIIRITPIQRECVKTETIHILPCCQSGSTLRFLLPVAAALGVKAAFLREGRLPLRPMSPLTSQLMEHGASVTEGSSQELEVEGRLSSGFFRMEGNVSSQFISGLLMALPLLDEVSVIEIAGVLESAPYVDMTLQALKEFGIKVCATASGYKVYPARPAITPERFSLEGDWSSAAFWVVAGATNSPLASPLVCHGMNPGSVQGDRRVIEIMRSMGTRMEEEGDSVTIYPSQLNAIEISVTHTPDLVPALTAAAAVAKGKTVFSGIGRLRMKESDRVASVCQMLESCGIRFEVTDETLAVYGREHTVPQESSPFIICSEGDHRIAMAASVLAHALKATAIISDAGCCAKSYPTFFETYRHLGGDILFIS